MRKLWHHWYGKLLFIGTLLLVVFAAASMAAASYTERSSFCISACHEMNPYGVTWETSVHRQVPCVKCHIKPGAVELVKAKAAAMREVYVHFTGEVKAPISVTRHVPDSTCGQSGCHTRRATYDRVVLRDVATPPGAGGTASISSAGGTGAGGGTILVAAAGTAPGAAPLAPASGSPAASRPAAPGPPVVFTHQQHTGVPLCIDCHDRVVHGDVPGKSFVDPRSMAFCLRCHDGTRAPSSCETCHKPPHAPRGACTDCHTGGTWANELQASDRARAAAQDRRLRAVPLPVLVRDDRVRGRVRVVSRQAAQDGHRGALRQVPRAHALQALDLQAPGLRLRGLPHTAAPGARGLQALPHHHVVGEPPAASARARRPAHVLHL